MLGMVREALMTAASGKGGEVLVIIATLFLDGAAPLVRVYVEPERIESSVAAALPVVWPLAYQPLPDGESHSATAVREVVVAPMEAVVTIERAAVFTPRPRMPPMPHAHQLSSLRN